MFITNMSAITKASLINYSLCAKYLCDTAKTLEYAHILYRPMSLFYFCTHHEKHVASISTNYKRLCLELNKPVMQSHRSKVFNRSKMMLEYQIELQQTICLNYNLPIMHSSASDVLRLLEFGIIPVKCDVFY